MQNVRQTMQIRYRPFEERLELTKMDTGPPAPNKRGQDTMISLSRNEALCLADYINENLRDK